MPKTKILLIASFDRSLINFRGDFISELLKQGFEVLCAAPNFENDIVQKINEMGAVAIPIELQRTGLNPFKDFRTVRQLRKVIKENQIDLVFPYTIKPVIYGSFAAKRLNVPVISLITGLGLTFSRVSLKYRFLETITTFLYRRALRTNKAVVFQNDDDRLLFISKKIVKEKQVLEVVHGSGINIDRFEYRTNIKKMEDPIKFIVVGRMIESKGILLFIEAAKKLKEEYAQAEFHLVGMPPKGVTSGLTLTFLKGLQKEGTIFFHGLQKNVIPVLTSSDVFVLPSFLREGVPRSILEALAIGLPIITTDMPGCKGTVQKDKNGILIPPKQLDSLVDAMRYFLDNPDRIESMGKSSRRLAEEKFDVRLINADLLRIIQDYS
ncbi:MAG: glycosyltransferase family 4 protein [Aurantibacter sp.]